MFNYVSAATGRDSRNLLVSGVMYTSGEVRIRFRCIPMGFLGSCLFRSSRDFQSSRPTVCIGGINKCQSA